MTKRSKTPKSKRHIPKFSDYEEEARWWDTHDFTGFLDELKPVKVKFTKNLSRPINIRLDPKTLAHLRLIARKKGIGPTTLARMWILEKIAPV